MVRYCSVSRFALSTVCSVQKSNFNITMCGLFLNQRIEPNRATGKKPWYVICHINYVQKYPFKPTPTQGTSGGGMHYKYLVEIIHCVPNPLTRFKIRRMYCINQNTLRQQQDQFPTKLEAEEAWSMHNGMIYHEYVHTWIETKSSGGKNMASLQVCTSCLANWIWWGFHKYPVCMTLH